MADKKEPKDPKDPSKAKSKDKPKKPRSKSTTPPAVAPLPLSAAQPAQSPQPTSPRGFSSDRDDSPNPTGRPAAQKVFGYSIGLEPASPGRSPRGGAPAQPPRQAKSLPQPAQALTDSKIEMFKTQSDSKLRPPNPNSRNFTLDFNNITGQYLKSKSSDGQEKLYAVIVDGFGLDMVEIAAGADGQALRSLKIRPTLHHKNIVKLRHHIEEERCLLIFEEPTSCLLSELMQARQTNFSEKDVCFIGIGIAAALEYLHKQGLKHGCVKPSSVRVITQVHTVTNIKLAGFNNTVHVKPGGLYSSPEERCPLSRDSTIRFPIIYSFTDPCVLCHSVWALGLLLTELATPPKHFGTYIPFIPAKSDEGLLHDIPDRKEFGGLCALIKDMTDPAPSKRPTAAEVHQRLADLYKASGRSRRPSATTAATVAFSEIEDSQQ